MKKKKTILQNLFLCHTTCSDKKDKTGQNKYVSYFLFCAANSAAHFYFIKL